jgi:hypothetical protein
MSAILTKSKSSLPWGVGEARRKDEDEGGSFRNQKAFRHISFRKIDEYVAC